MPTPDPHLIATRIVRDAGGKLIGRTRLQKVAYLTQLAGLADEFRFEYRRFGPFSDNLARGMEIAVALGEVSEEEKRADWGGWYSIYQTKDHPTSAEDKRARFVREAAKINTIELELAATAAFLASEERIPDPWGETKRRKPMKAADGRLERAKQAYASLRNAFTDHLPELPQD